MSAPKYEQDPVLFKIILLVGIVALAFVVMLWALDLVEVHGQEELRCVAFNDKTVVAIETVHCNGFLDTISHFVKQGYKIEAITDNEEGCDRCGWLIMVKY